MNEFAQRKISRISEYAATTNRVSIEQIRQPIAMDLESVDALISDRLHTDVDLIKNISGHIIGSGGKRLRPVTMLLAGQLFSPGHAQRIIIAAVIELIHTATLMHDDVVDDSSQRRGKTTAHEIWGNAASVLSGDFLYTRAFQLMVETQNMQIIEVFADCTNSIAEGEVLQLLHGHTLDTTADQYFQTIKRKTSVLFAAAAELGAVLHGESARRRKILYRYGLQLGNAYQLIDDCLDYVSASSRLGKNAGDDWAEGKVTLPLIHAYQTGRPAQRRFIRDAYDNRNVENFQEVKNIILETGGIAHTRKAAEKAVRKAQEALLSLPNSKPRQNLADLAEYSLSRSF